MEYEEVLGEVEEFLEGEVRAYGVCALPSGVDAFFFGV